MLMSQTQKILIFLMRIGLGWYMFWAGITKVLDPLWSSAGFLSGAKTFPAFFHLFLSPSILPIVNFLNQWGLTLIGLSLILGIAVRWSTYFGAALLMFYYFAHGFPRPDAYTYIVNLHVVFALTLLYLGSVRAGSIWGISGWFSRLSICSKFPAIRRFID